MKRLVLMVAMALIALPSFAAELPATVLYYRVSEPGVEPYLSRWLITDKFVRIDEGDANDNFILLDRNARVIYSVVHRDHTVLDIPYRTANKKPPKRLKQQSRIVQDDKVPLIDGMRPLHRELTVNGALCYDVVSVEKLLPDVVRAMSEYRQVMAGEQAKNMENTPSELQQPCDLALHIFFPQWLLEKGLPIQEWSPQGKASALLNYKTGEKVESALFVLPQDFRHYQTQSKQ